MAYLYYPEEKLKTRRQFLQPADGVSFVESELEGIFGKEFVIEQLKSWLGKKYEFMTFHKYRWIVYCKKNKNSMLNIRVGHFAEHKIYGKSAVFEDDEIDITTNELSNHLYDY